MFDDEEEDDDDEDEEDDDDEDEDEDEVDDAGHWHVCVSTVQLVAPMSLRPGIGKLSFRRVFRLCLAPLVLSERRDVDELELDEPDELLDVAVDDMHGQPSAHEP